jgi:hypothetical protein
MSIPNVMGWIFGILLVAVLEFLFYQWGYRQGRKEERAEIMSEYNLPLLKPGFSVTNPTENKW